MSHVHSAINAYIQDFPTGTLHSIKVIAEPTIQSAETAFHIRNLLLNVNYPVSEQITDLGIQFNYYQKSNNIFVRISITIFCSCLFKGCVKEFVSFQRIQNLYILRQYFTPDENNATHPTLQVHILIGDGKLFTSFRQEMVLSRLLVEPIPRFSTMPDPGYNALKHGHGFFFEAIGEDSIRLYEELTLARARGIRDDQRIATEHSLRLPSRELRYWLRNPSGPCVLSYFVDNRDRLTLAVVDSGSMYHQHIARTIRSEWNPYLAGI